MAFSVGSAPHCLAVRSRCAVDTLCDWVGTSARDYTMARRLASFGLAELRLCLVWLLSDMLRNPSTVLLGRGIPSGFACAFSRLLQQALSLYPRNVPSFENILRPSRSKQAKCDVNWWVVFAFTMKSQGRVARGSQSKGWACLLALANQKKNAVLFDYLCTLSLSYVCPCFRRSSYMAEVAMGLGCQ